MDSQTREGLEKGSEVYYSERNQALSVREVS